MSNIRRIRESLSMTQAELGEALGVTQGSVSFYELGKHPVPPGVAATLIEVAAKKGLTVSFDDIYRADAAHATAQA